MQELTILPSTASESGRCPACQLEPLLQVSVWSRLNKLLQQLFLITLNNNNVASLNMVVQAAAADEAVTTAVCDVSDSAPDQCAPHQQGHASLAVIPGTTHVHCGPVHQYPGMSLVSFATFQWMI